MTASHCCQHYLSTFPLSSTFPECFGEVNCYQWFLSSVIPVFSNHREPSNLAAIHLFQGASSDYLITQISRPHNSLFTDGISQRYDCYRRSGKNGSFVMRNRIHKGLFEGEKMKAKSGCRREQ